MYQYQVHLWIARILGAIVILMGIALIAAMVVNWV